MNRPNLRRVSLSGSIPVALGLAFAGACVTSPPVEDELAGESAADDATPKADQPAPTGFHLARRAAGVVVLDRVNRSTTPCLGGPDGATCRLDAGALDWRGSGLSPAQVDQVLGALDGAGADPDAPSVVLRGVIRDGRFAVSEAWRALLDDGGDGDGVYVRVQDALVRCVTSPCPTLREAKLNSSMSALLGGVELEDTGLDDAALEAPRAAMAPIGDGVLVAGLRTRRSDGLRSRSVEQLWLRVGPE